jgi:hypothetical protein
MLRNAPALVALAALAALAMPTAAGAKEVASLSVCGPGSCHMIKDRAAMRAFPSGGYETLAPKRGGAFYKVNAHMRQEGQDAGGYTVLYVPAVGLLRAEAEFSGHTWLEPAAVTASALRRAVRGLRPYPAGQLGPVREPSPAPVESPPARVSSPASGGGFPAVGFAGGIGVLIAALAATTLVIQRRRHAA